MQSNEEWRTKEKEQDRWIRERVVRNEVEEEEENSTEGTTRKTKEVNS